MMRSRGRVSEDPFHILVTGSRLYEDRPQMIRALSDASALAEEGQPLVIRHGGAKGADTLAGDAWTDWHYVWPRWLMPEVYMADSAVHGNRADTHRNTRMLKDIDVALCFPTRTDRATWDYIRQIEAAGIPCFNCSAGVSLASTPNPDGTRHYFLKQLGVTSEASSRRWPRHSRSRSPHPILPAETVKRMSENIVPMRIEHSPERDGFVSWTDLHPDGTKTVTWVPAEDDGTDEEPEGTDPTG